MKKYEYTALKLLSDFDRGGSTYYYEFKGKEYLYKSMQDTLNLLNIMGQDGWKMCQCPYKSVDIFFRRTIEE